MDLRIEVTKFMLVLFLLSAVVAEKWAVLRVGPNEYTTSRALKWVSSNTSTEVIEDAVVGFVKTERIPNPNTEDDDSDETYAYLQKETKFYICKARDQDGNWALGTVSNSDRYCRYGASHYKVLQNVKGAVHLKWQDIKFHDRQVEIPTNVVTLDDHYIIARIPDEKFKNATVRSYRILGMAEESRLEQGLGRPDRIARLGGQVLVGMEPVLYEVDIYETQNKSDSNELNGTVLKLAEITLRNTQPSPMNVESVIPFQWLHKSNWSSNETMLPGVNTTLSTNHFNISGKFKWSKEPVEWNTQKEEIRSDLVRVSLFLPAQTGVNITLQAKILDVEDTFLGSLSTVYNDEDMHHENSRPISVVWQRTVLTNLETIYGSMFQLPTNPITATMANNSSVVTNSIPAVTSSTNKTINLEKGYSSTNSSNTPPILTASRSALSARTTTSTASPMTTTFPNPTTSIPPQPTPSTPAPANTTTFTTTPYPTTQSTTPTPTTNPTTSTSSTYPPPTHPPSTTTTTTTPLPEPTPSPSPSPITTTTPSNSINFDMTLFFKLKMKIPVKQMAPSRS